MTGSGCGANSPFSRDSEDHSADQQYEVSRSGNKQFTLFFIGDTGDPSTEPIESNLRVLQHHLEKAGEHSAIVFMGDNIYNYGLLPEDHPGREDSERRIDTQLQILSNYQGRAIFIPGNHDWNNDREGGLEAIKRQQEYIDNNLGSASFAPRNGCPGPFEVQLDSSNVLLLIDTEWWLYPHAKPGLKACAHGSRDRFIQAMDSLARHHDQHNIFIAGHHPIYSNGTHGGHFPVKKHLFPLLKYNSSLYLPLPIIGSVNPLYRKTVGYRQDLAGKEYRQLREGLEGVFQKYSNLLYASGHDHSLQYHPVGGQHYVVAGAGTVTSYVRRGKSADFAYSHKGFARVDIDENESILTFWTPEGDRPEGRMVYVKTLYNN